MYKPMLLEIGNDSMLFEFVNIYGWSKTATLKGVSCYNILCLTMYVSQPTKIW